MPIRGATSDSNWHFRPVTGFYPIKLVTWAYINFGFLFFSYCLFGRVNRTLYLNLQLRAEIPQSSQVIK